MSQNNQAVEAMIEQGFEQLRDGHFEAAIEAFTTVHHLEPQDDRPLRGRGVAYTQIKEASKAEQDFRAAMERNEGHPDNWMGLALSLAMQNRIYDAIGVYEALLERQPGYIPGRIQMGRLYFKVGVIAKGKEEFEKVLTLRPNLEQRRLVEATLKEQAKLDQGRYYRPDFEKLRKRSGGPSGLSKFIRGLFR